MKKLLLACIVISCVSASHASPIARIYQQGMIAVREGNVIAAEAAFNEVLRLQPGHANARYQLAELKQNQGSIAARARAKKLSESVIGQIDFSKTEFSDAIAALGMLVEEETAGKFAPNFMIQDPSHQLATREVTLQVKHVPAKALLEMLLKQVGDVARYEQHAIIIRPVATTGQ